MSSITNKKKVAICYHGPPRSLRQVYKSHIECVLNPLVEVGIEYEIFVHTWMIYGNQFIWDMEIDVESDYKAFDLLNPRKIEKDIQNDFISKINLTEYFDENVWNKNKNSKIDCKLKGRSPKKLIENYICSLESQRRVTSMITSEFSYVIYIRPDSQFSKILNPNILLNSSCNEILLPRKGNAGGFNDKFSMMGYNVAQNYANRIKSFAEFRQKVKGQHWNSSSEKFTKYFIENSDYIKPKFIETLLTIIRPRKQSSIN